MHSTEAQISVENKRHIWVARVNGPLKVADSMTQKRKVDRSYGVTIDSPGGRGGGRNPLCRFGSQSAGRGNPIPWGEPPPSNQKYISPLHALTLTCLHIYVLVCLLMYTILTCTVCKYAWELTQDNLVLFPLHISSTGFVCMYYSKDYKNNFVLLVQPNQLKVKHVLYTKSHMNIRDCLSSKCLAF